MSVTYAKMPALLKLQEAFETPSGSVKATKTGEAYIVKSYDTEIFKVDFATGTCYYNVTRYSNTTTRLQRVLEEFICENKITIRLIFGPGCGFRF